MLQTDTNNCGACGNACANSDVCVRSTCTAMSSLALASGVAGVATMALDSGKVYFTDGVAAVQSVAITDGTVTTIAAAQEVPTGMAIDGDYVYWSNNLGAAIKRARKDGTGVPELVAAANLPTSVGVFGDYVYWVDADYTAIWRASKTGGTATNVISSSTQDMNGRYFAPTGIYYSYAIDTYQRSLHSLFGGWSTTVGRYSYFDAVDDYLVRLSWPGSFGSSKMQMMPLALRNSSNVQVATVLTKFNVTAATSDDQNVYFFADNAIYRLPLP